MFVEVTPEHLPMIAAQLGISTADLIAEIGTSAAAAVPVPPAIDDVSLMMPEVFGAYGTGFFGHTVQGVAYGTDGEMQLPQVGAAYSGEDILDGAQVRSVGTTFAVK
ncbi:PE domain-containing protein [Nocardia asteroides]